MIKIRSALNAEIVGWTIVITDDKNNKVHHIAIPPTTKNRIDVIVETRENNGFLINQQYLYNFLGNLKKLKGEKLIIRINNGNICIEK